MTTTTVDRVVASGADSGGSRPLWFSFATCICLAVVFVSSLSCGGGRKRKVLTPDASFETSGTAASPDQVRLTGHGVSGDTVQVDVIIHGQTTNGDLYSFAFDLLLSDPSVVEYVPGSATAGDALTQGASQGMSVMVSSQGDRVVVGVSKTGSGSGNRVPGGDHVVVSMDFRVPSAGMTTLEFVGSPANPQNPTANPAALDSAGGVIPSVSFDQAPAVILR